MKTPKSFKILIIEDNPGDCFLIEEMLREQFGSPEIVLARNFQDAKTVLAINQHFSVILVDLTLPDKNGEVLIYAILKIATCCPIIILTGYADLDFSIKSISLGIADYLLKDDLNAMALQKSIIYSIERRLFTSNLVESEKRYSDLFNLSPQPMWIYNLNTLRFIQVNNAGLLKYGYSEKEFLNLNILDIEAIKTSAEVEPKNAIHRHLKKCGDMIDVELHKTDLLIDELECRSVIAIDVTERNRFEFRLTQAIIRTQEEERYEVGTELHDNVCQILATSQLGLGILEESLVMTAEESPLMDQCQESIRQASNEIRRLSHRLAPAFYDSRSLEEEFRSLLSAVNIQNRYKTALDFGEELKCLSLDVAIKLSLYRILQEQLRNILKHASASLIQVKLSLHNAEIIMVISDNGVGFEMDLLQNGIGFANINRRIASLSGSFEVVSSPGHGCEIRVSIPYGKG